MRAIVATPLRRGALLLTIFLALFVCAVPASASQEKTGTQKQPIVVAPPDEENPGEPHPGSLTGYCISTDTERSITVEGTGWTLGNTVRFYLDGSAEPPEYNTAVDAGGYIRQRIDSPGFVPGRTVTIAAEYSGGALVPDEPTDTPGPFSTSTTVTCAAPPDTASPSITITTPAQDAKYTLNQVVMADYKCEDEVGGSGLKSCSGPVDSGAAIDTSSSGTKSFTVNAEDNAGNKSNLTYTYEVASAGGDGGGGTTGPTTTPGGGGGDDSSGGGVIATAGSVFSGVLAGQLPDT